MEKAVAAHNQPPVIIAENGDGGRTKTFNYFHTMQIARRRLPYVNHISEQYH